jgi:4-amino-4-deoxy-L-arabinose transferase-like glycosyltransferase
MAAVAAPPGAVRAPAGMPGRAAAARLSMWLPEAVVVAVACALRLIGLARVPLDPYYDAAVRSMGTSWGALLGGAFEPGRRVSIDKPPLDLWLQVAATKALGFGAFGLHLPEALGGIALVVLVMALLRPLFGRSAGLVGGLALAVLPSAVVTARSDTMDSVMAALCVAGAVVAVRSGKRGRAGGMAGAGLLVGLAFDVKLAESLLGAVAVGGFWLACAPRGAVRRRGVGIGAAAFALTAVAWLVAVSIVPLHPRPWALGASNGSPWNAALVYNGLDRLDGRAARIDAAAAGDTANGAQPSVPLGPRAAAQRAATLRRRVAEHQVALERRPAGPSPWRLLTARAHVGAWIGVEAALAVAMLLAGWQASAAFAVVALWFLGGVALNSAMPDLHVRYLATLDPAVACAIGAGAARLRWGRAALLALLVPAVVSAGVVARASQDSGRPGALPAARVDALSKFLDNDDAAGQLAAAAPAKAAQLIARDGKPTLLLSDGYGRQLVTPQHLQQLVANGTIRYALLGASCSADSGTSATGCLPVVRWAHRHGTDVSDLAGQPHRGTLYALTTAAVPVAAGTGRTPTCATSSRTPRSTGSSSDRPASRGPGGQGVHVLPTSRICSPSTRTRARPAPGSTAVPSRYSRPAAASGPSTSTRCPRTAARSRRRGRPGRRFRGSRGSAAAGPDGTAAAPCSHPRPAPRPRAGPTARTPAARSSRRRSTRR